MCTVVKSGARPDLVVKWLACLATKPENQDRLPGAHIFSACFSFFFNVLMLIYFILKLVKWHHQNDQNGHS